MDHVDATAGIEIVQQLLSAGQPVPAAQAAARLRGRFPLNAELYTLQARCALAAGDAEQALAVLLDKLELLDLQDRDQPLLRALLKPQEGPGAAPARPSRRPELLASASVRELLRRGDLARFESLGHNCEFGFVQRHAGHEPLGLFRWGTMPREQMVRLFVSDFAGFCRAGSCELRLHINEETGASEYRFCDNDFQYEVHTNQSDKVLGADGEPAFLLRKSLVHFQFLARSLRENLRAADKVCVYLSPWPMDLAASQALLAALRTLGNNRLLVVTDGHDSPLPEITHRSPHLMTGRIDQFKTAAPHLAAWNALIAEASRHFYAEVVW